DDSVVKVTLAEPVLVVATKYGRLTVPAADVRKVELGFRYPEGAEAKIDRAVQDLGSPSFETREAAEKTLVGFDHLAVPAARRATHPGWLATAGEVAAGQTLEISATGRIEMRPTLPGRYASGPDGLTNLAALAAAAPPPAGPGMPAPPAVGIPGQLIGRVGPNG